MASSPGPREVLRGYEVFPGPVAPPGLRLFWVKIALSRPASPACLREVQVDTACLVVFLLGDSRTPLSPRITAWDKVGGRFKCFALPPPPPTQCSPGCCVFIPTLEFWGPRHLLRLPAPCDLSGQPVLLSSSPHTANPRAGGGDLHLFRDLGVSFAQIASPGWAGCGAFAFPAPLENRTVLPGSGLFLPISVNVHGAGSGTEIDRLRDS